MTSGESLFEQRRSVRAYLDRPVTRDTVARLLTVARMAPSGANLQPGRFHVLAGEPLRALSAVLVQAEAEGRPVVREYSYFPNPMPADLKMRQIAAGYALYQSLGIEKRDLQGRRDQFARNYRFFDAPVGIVVTIRRGMGSGCFMDLGMALQSLMLAATAEGLATCGIGALGNYGDLVHAHLSLPEDEVVVCGMALGYPVPDAAVNQFRTDRDALDVFATFNGF